MRIYECPSCGEIFAEDSDDDSSVCPNCDEPNCYFVRDMDDSDSIDDSEE